MTKLLEQLVLGTWQLNSWEFNNHKQLQKNYEQALELGINKFDTAESYGNGLAEMVLGRAFKKQRERVLIYSKFSHHHSSPVLIRKALERTLKRLNTDYLDLYFQHWPNPKVSLHEVLESLIKLKELGLIRGIGFCNLSTEQIQQFGNTDQIDFIQNCYNPVWRKDEESVFLSCKDLNIKYMSYSPLAQGLLCNINFEGYKKGDPRNKNVFMREEFAGFLKEFQELIETIALEQSCSKASLLLHWNLRSGSVHQCVFATSNFRQLQEATQQIAADLDPYWPIFDQYYQKIYSFVEQFPSIWDWKP